MLTSLSHAKTLLVLSSVLPMSLFPNIAPAEQPRDPEALSSAQRGSVVGLLLYAIGSGVVRYELTGTESRRKNEKWFS